MKVESTHTTSQGAGSSSSFSSEFERLYGEKVNKLREGRVVTGSVCDINKEFVDFLNRLDVMENIHPLFLQDQNSCKQQEKAEETQQKQQESVQSQSANVSQPNDEQVDEEQLGDAMQALVS